MILKEFINLLLEDILSDLMAKNPENAEKLQLAQTSGVKPKYLSWLSRILKRTQEPVEDIIPLLKTFDTKQQVLKNKFGGQATDIDTYKSVKDLSDRLESLNKAVEASNSVDTSGFDVLYQDNQWIVAMPRTTQESCDLGSGTSWCTARTQSQNLFLSYTARGENIFLFYVINKLENPRKNPDAKISIGFVNGNPDFSATHGGLTVNAANAGISQKRFQEIVGPENAGKFLGLMKSKIEEYKGTHPAQKELDFYASNAEALQKKLSSFKKEEERRDFLFMVAKNQNTPVELLISLSQDPDYEIRENVAENPKLPVEVIIALSSPSEELSVRNNAIKNPSMPVKNLIALSQDPLWNIRASVAENPSLPYKVLSTLSRDENDNVRHYVMLNPKIDWNILIQLAHDSDKDVKKTAIEKLWQLYPDDLQTDPHDDPEINEY